MIRATKLLVLVALAGACGEVSNGVSADDDPTIVSLAPDHGPAIGGVTVTVTGTGFTGDALVVVDGVAAKDAMVASSSTITFTLPPGAEGHKVDVEVSTSKGFATGVAAFRYNLRPVVLSISPALGRAAGGTSVTVTGRGFQIDEADVPTISIGGSPAVSVQIIDDKTIMATTAAADPTVPAFVLSDVALTNKNGSDTLAKSFTLTRQGLMVNTGNQQQFYLDPTTKQAVQLQSLNQQQFGTCSLGPNGKLYGKHRRSDSAWELINYDPITLTVTPIGPFYPPGNNDAPALAFLGNALYLTSRRTQTFYSVNPATGTATVVAAAQAYQPVPTIAPKDASTLWLASNTRTALQMITVATGAVSNGVTLAGPVPAQITGLATVNGVLYAGTNTSPGIIYSVNTTSGAMTQVGSVSGGIKGICQTPSAF